jgi:hypothetical protein
MEKLVNPIILGSRPLLASVRATAGSGHRRIRRKWPAPARNLSTGKDPEAFALHGSGPGRRDYGDFTLTCPTQANSCRRLLRNPTAVCFLFDTTILPDSRHGKSSLNPLAQPGMPQECLLEIRNVWTMRCQGAVTAGEPTHDAPIGALVDRMREGVVGPVGGVLIRASKLTVVLAGPRAASNGSRGERRRGRADCHQSRRSGRS